MAYFVALVSAALYGAADFLGGLASRGAATVTVVAVSQLAGLLLLALLLPMLPPAAVSAGDVAWGVAAGLCGSAGVALLYRALAIGTMSIVAPTTAVCAVAIPVFVDVAFGAWPAVRVALGIAVALVAIVLVSQHGSEVAAARQVNAHPRLPPGLGLAFISGVAIGFFFLTLAQTSSAAGLWPLVPARAVSVLLFGALALAGSGLRLPRRVLAIALGGGVLDMLANACYLIAVREGTLAPVVTLSSLYPASTVLLARVVLRERISRVQALGIGAALLAVVLIVA